MALVWGTNTLCDYVLRGVSKKDEKLETYTLEHRRVIVVTMVGWSEECKKAIRDWTKDEELMSYLHDNNIKVFGIDSELLQTKNNYYLQKYFPYVEAYLNVSAGTENAAKNRRIKDEIRTKDGKKEKLIDCLITPEKLLEALRYWFESDFELEKETTAHLRKKLSV